MIFTFSFCSLLMFSGRFRPQKTGGRRGKIELHESEKATHQTHKTSIVSCLIDNFRHVIRMSFIFTAIFSFVLQVFLFGFHVEFLSVFFIFDPTISKIEANLISETTRNKITQFWNKIHIPKKLAREMVKASTNYF